MIEIAVDVTFDETDGSQKEQVNVENVGNEEAPHEAIKKLAIGEVKLLKTKMKTMLCMMILIQPFIMFHPMNMVKLPQQEIIKMGDQMKHKVILMKMVSTMSELNHNSTMKKEVKSTLHKLMIMIF